MSNERSPREVCSITIGTSGLMLAPCCRGSTVSQSFRASPSRASTASRALRRVRPGCASRRGEPVERRTQAYVLAQALVGAALAKLRHGFVESVVGILDL